jgi:hypothetical protein
MFSPYKKLLEILERENSMHRSELEPLLAKLTLGNIHSYLISTGWEAKSESLNSLVFERIDPRHEISDTIVIPASKHYKDFEARFIEFIESLCSIENRPTNEILFDLLNPQTDRLKIKISSTHSEKGSLSIPYAKKCIDAIKQLIIATIDNEIDPRPYYRKPKKSAVKLADYFRLGQTEFGSFVFVIETPVYPDDTKKQFNYNLFDSPSFNRRIFLRIINGINKMELIKEEKLFPKFEEGLNANMCEALLMLNQSSELETRIDCQIDWCIKFPMDLDINNSATLYPRTFRSLEHAARRLREVFENRYRITANFDRLANKTLELPFDEHTDILNKVVTINGLINRVESNNSNSYLISIVSQNLDKNITVFVPLNFKDFIEACLAFDQGLQVEVEGFLDKYGSDFILRDTHNFKILK